MLAYPAKTWGSAAEAILNLNCSLIKQAHFNLSRCIDGQLFLTLHLFSLYIHNDGQ